MMQHIVPDEDSITALSFRSTKTIVSKLQKYGLSKIVLFFYRKGERDLDLNL